MTTKRTPKKRSAGEWQPAFLATLRNTGNVRASCQAAQIERHIAYNWRDKSESFARAWDEALEDAVDALEAMARKRAQESSDTLLIFLLKAHRPEKYRERYEVRHSGKIDVTKLSDDELRAIVEDKSGG